MGNATSTKGEKQLYIAAMANVTQIERKEMGMIRKSFGDACVTGAYMINRDQLADAMTAAIQQLNAKVYGDERVDLCMLSNSDGITVALKR